MRDLALHFALACSLLTLRPGTVASRGRQNEERARRHMSLLNLAHLARSACLFAAALMIVSTAPARTQTAPARAQIPLKFSLDARAEGPAALFLVPQDKGYFRHEGLEVTIDDGTTPIEPITRVASGAYEMGFADINALIKYRDQNPSAPVKAVFMVYNKPPFAVVSRKSRGITEPKQL